MPCAAPPIRPWVRLERGERRVIDWRQYAQLVRTGARADRGGPSGAGRGGDRFGHRCEWLRRSRRDGAGGLPTGIYPPPPTSRRSTSCGTAERARDRRERGPARQDPRPTGRSPDLERAFLLDGRVAAADCAWVERWDDLLTRLGGDSVSAAEALANRLAALRPEGLGLDLHLRHREPKGVMLTHRNLTFTADATPRDPPHRFRGRGAELSADVASPSR